MSGEEVFTARVHASVETPMGTTGAPGNPRGAIEAIAQLIRIMRRCEDEGEWPRAVSLTIIVMLPKPDGGFRPIGLLPMLPRL